MENNDNGKLVSIIIPAYNVEKYIEKCLESILEQTYRNIEIIVVDDGSSDGTWDKIAALMKKDSRIHGLHQENKGVSAARNYALEVAKGYYIQFVDGDDFIPRESVEKLVYMIESKGVDWINFQYHRVDENGNPLDEYNFIKECTDLTTEGQKFIFLRDSLLDYLVGYEVWAKFYLAEIIQTNNLRFDENCHIGEDLEFNVCYSMYARNMLCVEDRLYNYRVRSGSAMQSISRLQKNFDERLALILGVQKSCEACFSDEYKRKFYQIYYKLMVYSWKGYSAADIVEAADDSPYKDYFYDNLLRALRFRNGFSEFFPEEKAQLYWRVGLYVWLQHKGNVIGRLYLMIYDLYRKICGRETISKWKII